MSFEKSTPNIRKFWLCITSFSTITLLSIGIGSYFLPQGRLNNDLLAYEESFQYIWNRSNDERPTESIKIIKDLFFSYDIGTGKLKDDNSNLKYLFKDNNFNPKTYNNARQAFLSYTDEDKTMLLLKIDELNKINYEDLSPKFAANTKAFQDFANKWIVDAQFQHLPSGGIYNSMVIAFSAVLTFPIYNFHFYRRFSGYNIWLKKLWNKRINCRKTNMQRNDKYTDVDILKFTAKNVNIFEFSVKELNSDDNLKYNKWSKVFGCIGGPLVLIGVSFLFAAFFVFSLSHIFSIVGSILLIFPIFSWLMFSVTFESDERRWKANRKDKSKPFHGRLMKADDYDSTSESV